MNFKGNLQRSEWVDLLTTQKKRKKSVPSKASTVSWLQRVAKRAKAAKGEDVDPGSFWSYDFTHEECRYTGRVYANTRSEARSEIKKRYKMKRVPAGATIVNKGKSPKLAKDKDEQDQ